MAAAAKLVMPQAKRTASPLPRSIAGVRDAAEIVGWTFRSEQGEVSNPILTPDFYIVAHLDQITEAGEPTLEAVEEEMRTGAMNQAKANCTPRRWWAPTWTKWQVRSVKP